MHARVKMREFGFNGFSYKIGANLLCSNTIKIKITKENLKAINIEQVEPMFLHPNNVPHFMRSLNVKFKEAEK